jgi:asparagine synthase
VLNRCVFVASSAERARQLERFYAPAGVRGLFLHEIPAARVVVGCIGPPPEAREVAAFGATVAWDDATVTLTTSATDVVSLYAADGAWSTHATAAAFLGTGEVRLRREAAAELAALGFVPGDATTVEGVRALPAGTVVKVDAAHPLRAPAAAPTPVRAPAAPAAAEQLLVDTLREHTSGSGPVTLGLSGGLDSRAVAVALIEGGVEFEAVTWGEEAWPDVAGARRVAQALGIPHRVVRPVGLGGDVDVGAGRARVRWADGAATITAPGADPDARGVHVTGAGGEIARAFYYRLLARADPEPSLDRVAALWRPSRGLPGSADRVRDAVDAAARAMLERAAARGASGWGVLDRVYADERMRKWGRATIPPAAAGFVPAFLHPRLVPALLALPLEDRLSAAFHRRVIAKRLPDLVPPVPPRQRRGVPRPLRRAAALRRARADPFAAPAGPPPPPALRETLLAATESDLVRGGIGTDFAARLRAGVTAGNPRAVETAAQLAGLVVFGEALAELRAGHE